MEKIDRLGWAAGISFVSEGLRLGVRVNEPSALPRIVTCLPVGWKPAPSPIVESLHSLIVGGPSPKPGVRKYNLLYRTSRRLARSMELDEVFDRLESDLQMIVAEFARRRVYVHAGVVGWQGQAIVIPGMSFSGKSTLVAELVKAGATYYSDEYAVLDLAGRVHPYARPLSLREEDGARPQRFTAEELGGTTGSKPLPIGLIVATHFRSGSRWRPRKRTAGQGVLALLANTVPARRKPKTVLPTLHKAVGQAQILHGVRGEASELIARLLRVDDTKGESSSRSQAILREVSL